MNDKTTPPSDEEHLLKEAQHIVSLMLGTSRQSVKITYQNPRRPAEQTVLLIQPDRLYLRQKDTFKLLESEFQLSTGILLLDKQTAPAGALTAFIRALKQLIQYARQKRASVIID